MTKIPVLKMAQRGYTIYVGQITAAELIRHGITTEWDPDLGWDLTQQGYQRAPVTKHYSQIGRFLARELEPLMPTAALLSAREGDYGKLLFVPLNHSKQLGTLEIPDDRHLFIVDYQHR